MKQIEDTKTAELSFAEKRGRGRPLKEGALSAAERAKRYREKQKAAGLIKRYTVTENASSIEQQDLAYWIASAKRLGELSRSAVSLQDYFRSENDRLNTECEVLLARARHSEQLYSIACKDLIVMRDKIKRLEK